MDSLEELLESMPAKIKIFKKEDDRYICEFEQAIFYLNKGSIGHSAFYRSVPFGNKGFSDCSYLGTESCKSAFEALFNLKMKLKAYNDEVNSQLNETIWIP